MNATDKPEFFSLLADVHDAYRVTCSPQAAEFWFATLQLQDIRRIREAFMAHSRHPQFGRFPPTPADVMREIESDSTPDYLVGAI